MFRPVLPIEAAVDTGIRLGHAVPGSGIFADDAF